MIRGIVMDATKALDVVTRHRYRQHLIDAEGVSGQEADAFLSVLSRGLSEGSAEASEMSARIEGRMAMTKDFRSAAEATTRLGRAEADTETALAALNHIASTSSSRATPSKLRALVDLAAREAAKIPVALG